jgi:hypothetical protein
MSTPHSPLEQGPRRTPGAGPFDRTRTATGIGPQTHCQLFSESSEPGMHPPGQIYAQQPLRPPYPNPASFPPPRTNYAKVVALVALALAPVSVLFLVMAWLYNSHATTTVVGDASTSEAVGAVCSPGTLGHPSQRDAPTFQGATDAAVCTAKVIAFPEAPDPSERWGPVWFIQFASPSAARNEAGTESLLGATAIGTIGGKNVVFVAPDDWTGVSLEPLAQFGFTIRPGR